MSASAKLFMSGQSQAVRLPKAFRFDGDAVDIRRDDLTGEVILKSRNTDWTGFFDLVQVTDVPDDFLSAADRIKDDLKDPFGDIAP